MSLRNACFISYRHAGPATPIVRAFCDVLQEQLALLAPSLPIYRDNLLGPGDYVEADLARGMCGSACMVLLFTPEYFDVHHSYCAREYRAMVALEKRRQDALPAELRKSLIIPVIMRGESRVPAELRPRLFKSFDRVLLQKSDLKKTGVVRSIYDVANAIYDRIDAMRSADPLLAVDCSQFSFPSDAEIADWLRAVAPPPLASPNHALI
ncbi:MAG TPA: TIR domain-containing protein [Thermoanaerobaculia bacterium]|nr:TIR domain-containing protein [Thermoanaerobaculia bacterium]